MHVLATFINIPSLYSLVAAKLAGLNG